MTESIYTSSKIFLFGRIVDDLAAVSTVGDGEDAALKKDSKQFARVYGFSYDGIYTEIATPVLFLVNEDEGVDADKAPVPGPNPHNKAFYHVLTAWEVDKSSDTVRLDIDQGKFEDILLAMAAEGIGGGVSGARVSGARVSGARVSGARVSGARVSGARISGARGDASD